MVIASIHRLPISKVAILCRPHGLSNSLICNGQSGSLIETRTRERDWGGGRESGRKRVCLGQLGYRVSLGVSNCGRALVASRLSGWPAQISQRDPGHTVRAAWAESLSSAFPALTIAGTRPAGAYPAGPLGHPHLVGPVGFGWRGACALFCCSQSPPPVPRAQCPGPSASAVASHALPWPCPAWPCLAMPCPALVSQVQPGRCPPARHCPVTRPSQSSRTRPPPSRPAVCLCLSSHHHHTTTTFFGLVARLLSFPGLTSPHPHLWLNSSGKSPEVSCLVLTVHSFNPFYLLDS